MTVGGLDLARRRDFSALVVLERQPDRLAVVEALRLPHRRFDEQLAALTPLIRSLDRLAFEEHDIVAACRIPQSIAEIAARLRLHLNVVRILAEDLRTAGQLTVHVPDTDVTHDASVLRRLIDGLRAIPDSRGVLRDTD